jgi:RNA polymerase sigma factor for flagellar operon FliA
LQASAEALIVVLSSGSSEPPGIACMKTIDVPPPKSSVVDRPHNGTAGSEIRLRELWRRYGEGDDTARENLVLNYAPLVKVVAGRLGSRLPSHVEEGDLIAYGLTGLLGAIERYDPERGIKFETFALTRIRGAMIDALRSLDWVPRRVRQYARELERVESGLRSKLGRAPNETELASGLGIEVETLGQHLLEVGNSRLLSFDAPMPGHAGIDEGDGNSLLDQMPSSDFADPQKELGAREGDDLSGILRDAIGDLPEQEQFILSCRYREDLRLGEIGEVMGVSESRVSQLHTKALISLRAVLGAAEGSASAGTLRLAHSWN